MYLRILGYIENKAWVAHCLEMDLRAEGPTFEKARDELLDLIRMQVSFAFFKDQANLLNHPAPAELFALFEHVSQSKLAAYPAAPAEEEFEITGIPLPKPSRRLFTEVHA